MLCAACVIVSCWPRTRCSISARAAARSSATSIPGEPHGVHDPEDHISPDDAEDAEEPLARVSGPPIAPPAPRSVGLGAVTFRAHAAVLSRGRTRSRARLLATVAVHPLAAGPPYAVVTA